MESLFWFAIAIPVVLFIHEIGHLLVARWCGVGVAELSVGFGPELIGYTDRLGTRWTLSLVPLGGWTKYVDLSPSIFSATSRTPGRLVSKLLKQRVAIYSAGALANFAFAAIIIVLILTISGGALTNLNVAFAFLVSVLSISVGLFNLMPVPPLDGWLLTSVAIEAVTNKPIPEPVQNKLFDIGISIILVATVVLSVLLINRWPADIQLRF